MIPLARDSQELYLWKYRAEEAEGDVTGDWTLCKKKLRVTLYQLSSTKEQLIEGQHVQRIYSIHIANDGSRTLDVRDRIGTKDTMLYEILELRQDALTIKATGVAL
ncbi:MAG: hypothetical protein E7Z65_06400 [Thermoplasmata archaeon]|nr:hypothetical protein [Thermoplasmata archaeon]